MCWTTRKSFPSWEIFIVKIERVKSIRKEIKRWTTVVDDFSESEEATTRQTSSSEAIQFYNHKANIWFPFLSIQYDSSLPFGFKLKPNANNEWRGVELSTSTKREILTGILQHNTNNISYVVSSSGSREKKLHLVAIQSRSTFSRLRLLLFRLGSSSHCFFVFWMHVHVLYLLLQLGVFHNVCIAWCLNQQQKKEKKATRMNKKPIFFSAHFLIDFEPFFFSFSYASSFFFCLFIIYLNRHEIGAS